MDKKGCMLGVAKNIKVLVPSNATTQFIQQPGTQESVTIIKCVSGKGQYLLPFIIWAAKTHCNNWHPLNALSLLFFATSPNSYIDKKLKYQWLSKVSEPATAFGVENQKRILLLDGQKSHLTGHFLGFCHNHNILLMCLPPHSTLLL